MNRRWPGPLPRLIGHRGAAAVAPENTLAGLRAAAEAGADWAEVDARLTADSVPVLVHDATLDRTTTGTGRVRHRQSGDLAVLDAGGWFDARFAGEPVPTLAQAIAVANELGLRLNVELKPDPDIVATTATVCVDTLAGQTAPFLVSCFDTDCLSAARNADSNLPLALNAERLTEDVLSAAGALGCVAIHLGADQVSGADIVRIRHAGMAAGIFTVNDIETGNRLWDAGADYLFTDNPAGLASI